MGQQHGGDPKDISKAMARIGMCYESEKDVEKGLTCSILRAAL